ncbi:hypothetical protein GWG65_29940 [Bradyrhizobium sp. CSA207]|uniref:hypothetical protein n=1 Tax=Bradyrhizobium sp. CSA207 TaxID=2698826 RepID=UPI0023B13470|nr:hypothetical protein [Bradyrhizobium sp. CSA207]MDE5445572.1 hypothetical protein [Bradyrhizobium sp. CSA207]
MSYPDEFAPMTELKRDMAIFDDSCLTHFDSKVDAGSDGTCGARKWQAFNQTWSVRAANAVRAKALNPRALMSDFFVFAARRRSEP